MGVERILSWSKNSCVNLSLHNVFDAFSLAVCVFGGGGRGRRGVNGIIIRD